MSGRGKRHWSVRPLQALSILFAATALAVVLVTGQARAEVASANTGVRPAATWASAADAAQAPVTTVTGADDLWHNHSVHLTFTAEGVTAAVASIEIRIDGGEILQIPSATYERTIEAPGDHSDDGAHLVEFRALDAAGTVEEWRSVTVKIDTRPPSVTLLHAVGAMRSSTAIVDYRVDDETPGAGAADVTYSVKLMSGRSIKTFVLRDRAVGSELSAKFWCDLPRGSYRIHLTARDLAGNEAVAGVDTRLVVTPWMRLHLFEVPIVSPGQSAYATSTPIPLVDNGLHDAQGVRMYRGVGGRLADYPGGQARFGLANLNSYRLTNNEVYLTRAIAQAHRLLDTHVRVGSAWFYPQRYSRYRHSVVGDSGSLMRNPWYSGMAQGQVISFMVGMYEATGQARYKTAARYTLNSFLDLGPRKGPWTVNLDGSRRYWIQEWPKLPLDNTFNGFMISSFGLYDYYRLTKDTLALVLFRAAASTALDYAPRFRRPGHPSVYCLLHKQTNLKYHFVHVACLRHLGDFTGDDRFRDMAALFLADYSGTQGSAARAATPGDPAAQVDLTSDALQQSP
jgi:hypothetical protein